MKLVTVIVPIYNVEHYVEKCVKSIQMQDYHELEIILVDDGSQDKSGQILDSLASCDERIIVIHKNNEGVSNARNTGLKIANGEYIVFVDGDDYLDYRYVTAFVNMLEKTKLNIGISYSYLRDEGVPSIKEDSIDTVTSDTACEQLYLNKVGVAVWNKIYRRDFLLNNNIIFNPEYWFAEGMTFNIDCFSKCEMVACCKHSLYHYRTNANSAVRKLNLESWHCGLSAMDYQCTVINRSNPRISNAYAYHRRQYNYSILCGIFKSKSEALYTAEIYQCKRGLRHNIWLPFIVNIGLKSKIKSALVIMMPVTLAKYDARRTLKREQLVHDAKIE